LASIAEDRTIGDSVVSGRTGKPHHMCFQLVIADGHRGTTPGRVVTNPSFIPGRRPTATSEGGGRGVAVGVALV
jgi:hypothetical protein